MDDATPPGPAGPSIGRRALHRSY